MKYWAIILVLIAGGIAWYLRPLPDLKKPCTESGGIYYEGRTEEGKIKMKWCVRDNRVYQGREILKFK